jgi:hypothetical protein
MPAMLDLLILAVAITGAAGDVRAPAPAAHCLDARAVSDVWWQSPTQLLVATGEKLHRVSTAMECPADAAGGSLLARDGWVCGSGGEFLQVSNLRCPISAVEPLSKSEARRAIRDRQRAERRVDATPLRQAFDGDSEQCLDPTRMRSWSTDGNDLIVTTARAGSSGQTRFRVRLVGNCPDAQVRDILHWRSATGLGRICGVPGEFAVFTSQHTGVVNLTRGILSGPPVAAESIGCPIAAVEAIER